MGTELSPILQTVKEILAPAGLKGMHVQEIAEVAVSQNKNHGLTVEQFKKKIQIALLANLKLKTARPSFACVKWDKGARKGKPRQGWYRVKVERLVPIEETIPVPQVAKGFTGRGGEYAVMSELLFWGYNASIMSVDDGIDIVASKGNKFFHIQVKTCTVQTNGKFTFSISRNPFKRYNAANVFYVLVLRHATRNEFIIIPSRQLQYFLDAGYISDGVTLSLSIAADARGAKFTLNGKADVTPFYGKFGEIIV